MVFAWGSLGVTAVIMITSTPRGQIMFRSGQHWALAAAPPLPIGAGSINRIKSSHCGPGHFRQKQASGLMHRPHNGSSAPPGSMRNCGDRQRRPPSADARLQEPMEGGTRRHYYAPLLSRRARGNHALGVTCSGPGLHRGRWQMGTGTVVCEAGCGRCGRPRRRPASAKFVHANTDSWRREEITLSAYRDAGDICCLVPASDLQGGGVGGSPESHRPQPRAASRSLVSRALLARCGKIRGCCNGDADIGILLSYSMTLPS